VMGPRNHVLDRGPDPACERSILRGKGEPIVKYRDLCHALCKTAELMEIPFGMCTRVGPRKYVLDGSHVVATWRIQLNHPCAMEMWPFRQVTLTTCFGL